VTTAARPVTTAHPLMPVLHRVVESWRETADVATLELVPLEDGLAAFRAGQFNMLTAFGVGEAAISISGPPGPREPLRHTVRDVGPVTHALCVARPGDLIGVRGPFGTDWGTGDLSGDVVVVAGGIGLAPLRGAVDQVLRIRSGAHAESGRSEGGSATSGIRVFVLVGAREPAQVLFSDDLCRWTDAGARVAVTVDVAPTSWTGHVGLVTTLLDDAGFEPACTTALLCGPEVMMRFTARALTDLGVDPARIRVSLERNMQCGLGWCGHCQLGPFLLCRDGPILPYAGAISRLLTQRER
jgi:anaerobic sulfite reductase subunit B